MLLVAGVGLVAMALLMPRAFRSLSDRIDVSEEFRSGVERVSAASRSAEPPFDSIPLDRWGSKWVYEFDRDTFEGRVFSAGPDRTYMRGRGDDLLLLYAAPRWITKGSHEARLEPFEAIPGAGLMVFYLHDLPVLFGAIGTCLLLAAPLLGLSAWLRARSSRALAAST